jgi:hypothetical protein
MVIVPPRLCSRILCENLQFPGTWIALQAARVE